MLWPKVIESTALGAVYLAGLAVGYYKDRKDIHQNVALGGTFRPEIEEFTRQELVGGWREAARRSFG